MADDARLDARLDGLCTTNIATPLTGTIDKWAVISNKIKVIHNRIKLRQLKLYPHSHRDGATGLLVAGTDDDSCVLFCAPVNGVPVGPPKTRQFPTCVDDSNPLYYEAIQKTIVVKPKNIGTVYPVVYVNFSVGETAVSYHLSGVNATDVSDVARCLYLVGCTDLVRTAEISNVCDCGLETDRYCKNKNFKCNFVRAAPASVTQPSPVTAPYAIVAPRPGVSKYPGPIGGEPLVCEYWRRVARFSASVKFRPHLDVDLTAERASQCVIKAYCRQQPDPDNALHASRAAVFLDITDDNIYALVHNGIRTTGNIAGHRWVLDYVPERSHYALRGTIAKVDYNPPPYGLYRTRFNDTWCVPGVTINPNSFFERNGSIVALTFAAAAVRGAYHYGYKTSLFTELCATSNAAFAVPSVLATKVIVEKAAVGAGFTSRVLNVGPTITVPSTWNDVDEFVEFVTKTNANHNRIVTCTRNPTQNTLELDIGNTKNKLSPTADSNVIAQLKKAADSCKSAIQALKPAISPSAINLTDANVSNVIGPILSSYYNETDMGTFRDTANDYTAAISEFFGLMPAFKLDPSPLPDCTSIDVLSVPAYNGSTNAKQVVHDIASSYDYPSVKTYNPDADQIFHYRSDEFVWSAYASLTNPNPAPVVRDSRASMPPKPELLPSVPNDVIADAASMTTLFTESPRLPSAPAVAPDPRIQNILDYYTNIDALARNVPFSASVMNLAKSDQDIIQRATLSLNALGTKIESFKDGTQRADSNDPALIESKNYGSPDFTSDNSIKKALNLHLKLATDKVADVAKYMYARELTRPGLDAYWPTFSGKNAITAENETIVGTLKGVDNAVGFFEGGIIQIGTIGNDEEIEKRYNPNKKLPWRIRVTTGRRTSTPVELPKLYFFGLKDKETTPDATNYNKQLEFYTMAKFNGPMTPHSIRAAVDACEMITSIISGARQQAFSRPATIGDTLVPNPFEAVTELLDARSAGFEAIDTDVKSVAQNIIKTREILSWDALKTKADEEGSRQIVSALNVRFPLNGARLAAYWAAELKARITNSLIVPWLENTKYRLGYQDSLAATTPPPVTLRPDGFPEVCPVFTEHVTRYDVLTALNAAGGTSVTRPLVHIYGPPRTYRSGLRGAWAPPAAFEAAKYKHAAKTYAGVAAANVELQFGTRRIPLADAVAVSTNQAQFAAASAEYVREFNSDTTDWQFAFGVRAAPRTIDEALELGNKITTVVEAIQTPPPMFLTRDRTGTERIDVVIKPPFPFDAPTLKHGTRDVRFVNRTPKSYTPRVVPRAPDMLSACDISSDDDKLTVALELYRDPTRDVRLICKNGAPSIMSKATFPKDQAYSTAFGYLKTSEPTANEYKYGTDDARLVAAGGEFDKLRRNLNVVMVNTVNGQIVQPTDKLLFTRDMFGKKYTFVQKAAVSRITDTNEALGGTTTKEKRHIIMASFKAVDVTYNVAAAAVALIPDGETIYIHCDSDTLTQLQHQANGQKTIASELLAKDFGDFYPTPEFGKRLVRINAKAHVYVPDFSDGTSIVFHDGDRVVADNIPNPLQYADSTVTVYESPLVHVDSVADHLKDEILSGLDAKITGHTSVTTSDNSLFVVKYDTAAAESNRRVALEITKDGSHWAVTLEKSPMRPFDTTTVNYFLGEARRILPQSAGPGASSFRTKVASDARIPNSSDADKKLYIDIVVELAAASSFNGLISGKPNDLSLVHFYTVNPSEFKSIFDEATELFAAVKPLTLSQASLRDFIKTRDPLSALNRDIRPAASWAVTDNDADWYSPIKPVSFNKHSDQWPQTATGFVCRTVSVLESFASTSAVTTLLMLCNFLVSLFAKPVRDASVGRDVIPELPWFASVIMFLFQNAILCAPPSLPYGLPLPSSPTVRFIGAVAVPAIGQLLHVSYVRPDIRPKIPISRGLARAEAVVYDGVSYSISGHYPEVESQSS
jgi:hypothetical protein